MNKAELVAAMAEKAELSKKDAEAALKAFTDVVAEELKKGEKIQLTHNSFLNKNVIEPGFSGLIFCAAGDIVSVG